MIRHLASALLLLGLAAACAAEGETHFDGRVVRVLDGDTLDVRVGGETRRIRIADIDTPERGQPWANRSKQALSQRVAGKSVRVNEVATDTYGRTVGEVYADDVCVGCELVREGHAWVWHHSDDRVLPGLEAEARAAGRGLWGLPEPQRMPPWEWRRGNRRAQAQREPAQKPRDPRCAGQGCNEMRSCEEARLQLRACGPAGLDGDGDGIPCERMCR